MNDMKCELESDSFLILQKTYFIDTMDSVSFNFSEATMSGIYVEFPVSIYSDDNIYAVDFSLKYNPLNVEFDTIINITTGLQYQYFFNPIDSTLRFTSNRLLAIPNDSNLIILKFKTFTGQMCANDIDSVLTYLNGDACSYRLIGCIVSAIHEVNEPVFSITTYPNPATTEFSYDVSGTIVIDEIKIFNTKGELVLMDKSEPKKPINIEPLPMGLYLIEFTNKSTGDRKRVKMVKAGNGN